MSQSTVYVGVDVSKKTLDLSAPGLRRSFSNTAKGHAQILRAVPKDSHIVLEASGGYERELIKVLHQAKHKNTKVNPRHVREFAKSMGQLAKTDKIDSSMIARFAECKKPSPDQPPTGSQLRLAELVARRSQLIAVRTSELNRLEHQEMPSVRKQTQKLVQLLDKQIAELEKAASDEIQAEEILRAKSKRICQVQGIAKVSAAAVLAFMPELGTLSRTEAAALLGVAPFVRESGQYKGLRRIQGGRADLRSMLYMCALVAARRNQVLKAFYKKLRAAGKPFKVAITAVMRKLIVLLNHLLAKPDFSLVP